jgi:hypothetical protein
MATKRKRAVDKSPVVHAKCIFGHKFTMTQQEQKAAQDFGCAMCPQCGNPATVTKIQVK